eukprot:scaffold281538_cov36-Tisochrysis_lutea.AAC.1
MRYATQLPDPATYAATTLAQAKRGTRPQAGAKRGSRCERASRLDERVRVNALPVGEQLFRNLGWGLLVCATIGPFHELVPIHHLGCRLANCSRKVGQHAQLGLSEDDLEEARGAPTRLRHVQGDGSVWPDRFPAPGAAGHA